MTLLKRATQIFWHILNLDQKSIPKSAQTKPEVTKCTNGKALQSEFLTVRKSVK